MVTRTLLKKTEKSKNFWMLYDDSIRGPKVYEVKFDSFEERDVKFYVIKNGEETATITIPQFTLKNKPRREFEELFTTEAEARVLWAILFVKDFQQSQGIPFDKMIELYQNILNTYPERWI